MRCMRELPNYFLCNAAVSGNAGGVVATERMSWNVTYYPTSDTFRWGTGWATSGWVASGQQVTQGSSSSPAVPSYTSPPSPAAPTTPSTSTALQNAQSAYTACMDAQPTVAQVQAEDNVDPTTAQALLAQQQTSYCGLVLQAALRSASAPTYTTPSPTSASTTPSCQSGWYVNTYGSCIPGPSPDPNLPVPAGPTAICADGTYSYSQTHSGTCSYHGGVSTWLG
jgi:hypothetical protein